MSYTLTIDQFTTGPTGHMNLTFGNSGTYETFGSNLGDSSGVQREDNSTRPSPTLSNTITLTEAQFNAARNFAVAADYLNNSYFVVGNNCYDFVAANLAVIGLDAKDFVLPGTLIGSYAVFAGYIANSEYVDLGTSNILGILGSPANVALAGEFMDHMSWLADHPNGSDFYQDPSNYHYRDPSDPDAEADYRFERLKAIGQQLGISVKKDPIQEKVILGVASPILIDMNGDGINTTAFSANAVSFDIDGDNVKDRTAWSDGTDGFLVVDVNQNGIVDGVSEMFGGLNRGDGYAKLGTFDSNADGVVNQLDSDFSKLSIWLDKNVDGITDAGELVSISDAKLESISVNYQSQDIYQNFNLIGEVSEAVVDGQIRAAADVYFKYEPGVTSSTVDAQVAALISAMSNTFVEGAASTSSYDTSALTPTSLTIAAV